jgi:hypothetical protein
MTLRRGLLLANNRGHCIKFRKVDAETGDEVDSAEIAPA